MVIYIRFNHNEIKKKKTFNKDYQFFFFTKIHSVRSHSENLITVNAELNLKFHGNSCISSRVTAPTKFLFHTDKQ